MRGDASSADFPRGSWSRRTLFRNCEEATFSAIVEVEIINSTQSRGSARIGFKRHRERRGKAIIGEVHLVQRYRRKSPMDSCFEPRLRLHNDANRTIQPVRRQFLEPPEQASMRRPMLITPFVSAVPVAATP